MHHPRFATTPPRHAPRFDARAGAPALLALGLLSSGEARAQGFTLVPEIPPLTASAPGERFGWAVAAIGDVSGDGKTDFAVGAPGAASSAGVVRVYSGADGSLLYSVAGDANARMGSSLAALGDVNGDGVPDFAAGAVGSNLSQQGPIGYVAIVSGVDGQEIRRFTGGTVAELFGSALANTGDLDADGKDDLLVGGPGGSSNFAGVARAYSTSNGILLGTFNGSGFQSLGRAVASAGDVNGDGIPDVAVGSPGVDASSTALRAGLVEVFSGTDWTKLGSLSGKAHNENLGESLAYAGAFGPTAHGLLVGSIGHANSSGRIVLHETAKLKPLVTAASSTPGDFLGACAAALGDVNGDGVPDFAAGAPGQDPPAIGAVLAYSGKKGPASQLGILENDFGKNLGKAIAGLGDVSGDGLPKILVGAWGGANGGEARVYSMAGLFGKSVKGTVGFKLALQRPEGAPDGDARGAIAASIGAKTHGFSVQVQKLDLPEGDPLFVFLEAGKGSGTFAPATQLTLAKGGKGSVKLSGLDVAAALGLTNLGQLEGRAVEVRDSNGAVYLTALLPRLAGFPDFAAAAALLPPTPGAPSGSCKVAFKTATGVSTIDVKTKLLPKGPLYTAHLEDAPGSGTFISLGALVKGNLKIDTKTGAGLPGLVANASGLAGRAVEIRDGADAVLSGTLP